MTALSILNNTKEALGVGADDTSFDVEIKMHINSCLAELSQLGLGPDGGFSITSATDSWDDFFGLAPFKELNSALSYMFIYVQMLFDASTMPGPVIAMKERQMLQFQWRLQVAADPPLPLDFDDPDGDGIILDGGTP